MEDQDDTFDLTGKLLIATPGLNDPRFANSVIFICDHSDKGAMGLIINMPAPEIRIEGILAQLDIPVAEGTKDILIHFGGPVETSRGFVLHTNDYVGGDGTMQVTPEFSMTASVEILQRLARGDGPAYALLMLGYSGWGPGQLESEIVQNGWIVSDAMPGIVFMGAADEKWANALRAAGIDPRLLSTEGGSA